MQGFGRTARAGTILAGLLALVTSVADAAPPASMHAIKPAPLVRIRTNASVLQGNSASFRVLGTVDRREVFLTIPAYRTLCKERLTRRDPRYHFLLRQANEAFECALQRVSQRSGVDLVVERGEVESIGLEVIDLTRWLCETFDPPKPKR